MASVSGAVEILIIPTAGRCMVPWIWPGGRLHVERCTVEDLNVGDIAVWFTGSRLVSHRVWNVGKGSFTTRADDVEQEDAVALRHQLLGRAVRFAYGRLSYRLDGPAARQWGHLVANRKVNWLVRHVARGVEIVRSFSGRPPNRN